MKPRVGVWGGTEPLLGFYEEGSNETKSRVGFGKGPIPFLDL